MKSITLSISWSFIGWFPVRRLVQVFRHDGHFGHSQFVQIGLFLG
jgi:hypothetical protein